MYIWIAKMNENEGFQNWWSTVTSVIKVTRELSFLLLSSILKTKYCSRIKMQTFLWKSCIIFHKKIGVKVFKYGHMKAEKTNKYNWKKKKKLMMPIQRSAGIYYQVPHSLATMHTILWGLFSSRMGLMDISAQLQFNLP